MKDIEFELGQEVYAVLYYGLTEKYTIAKVYVAEIRLAGDGDVDYSFCNKKNLKDEGSQIFPFLNRDRVFTSMIKAKREAKRLINKKISELKEEISRIEQL